jgi:hypothetical protein
MIETMKIVLLVTWLVSGQPPSSYQVTFDSWEKCNAAKEAVLRDRDRVREQMGLLPLGVFASVSAVCAAQ